MYGHARIKSPTSWFPAATLIGANSKHVVPDGDSAAQGSGINLVYLAATACRSRLNALALTDLHSRLVVDGGRPHALFDLPCHRQESLFDVRCILGRGLKERNS